MLNHAAALLMLADTTCRPESGPRARRPHTNSRHAGKKWRRPAAIDRACVLKAATRSIRGPGVSLRPTARRYVTGFAARTLTPTSALPRFQRHEMETYVLLGCGLGLGLLIAVWGIWSLR